MRAYETSLQCEIEPGLLNHMLHWMCKTYETTGQQSPQYDVATMMPSPQDSGFDSHPYDELVEMSSRRNTGSFA